MATRAERLELWGERLNALWTSSPSLCCGCALSVCFVRWGCLSAGCRRYCLRERVALAVRKVEQLHKLAIASPGHQSERPW